MAPTISGCLSWASAGNAARASAATAAISADIRPLMSLSFVTAETTPPRCARHALLHSDETTPKRRRGGRLPPPAPHDQHQQGEPVGQHVHDERRDVGAGRLKLQ